MARWPKRSLEERFWEKVNRRGPDDCWMWMANKDKDGYGMFRIGRCYPPYVRSHALILAWKIGPTHKSIQALHTCDHPSCVNPAHIYPGTYMDNVRDRQRKGRSAVNRFHGMKHPRVKLTDAQVLDIRARRSENQTHMARQYGISAKTINSILCGRSWKHLL